MTKDSPKKEEYKSKNKFVNLQSAKREGKINLVNYVRDNLKAKTVVNLKAKTVIDLRKSVENLSKEVKIALSLKVSMRLKDPERITRRLW